jgi:hypothetical protein
MTSTPLEDRRNDEDDEEDENEILDREEAKSEGPYSDDM